VNNKETSANICIQLAENPFQIKLHMGELTANEMRCVRAALGLAAYLIRKGKTNSK